jgi:cystathionine beta-lyase
MKDRTRVVTAGRDPAAQHGIVNPPVWHASTVLFPSLAALEEASRSPHRGVFYGRRGTPTSFALEDAIAEIEGGAQCRLCPSGLAAIATALLAFLGSGDHLLMVDSVYGPTRAFCDGTLRRFGVETTYYDPLIGARIADLIRSDTRVVFVESPGSLTFEVQDVPAIAAAAHARGAYVLMDNTWASPLYFKPFAHGVDVSIQAATKYLVGHSDAMLGSITTTEESWPQLLRAHGQLGQCAGPDDIYLGQRGLRTLAVRLERHWQNGLILAEWLRTRPEVARVLHPALPDDPGHALWRRDFLGASGLFAAVLHPCSKAALAAMVDDLQLFGMGYSWGGYESLVLPSDPRPLRSATEWREEGRLLRFHAGLEDIDDLIADLEAGFARLNATAASDPTSPDHATDA